MEDPGDRLLTVAEVASYFRVDPESVRRWLREGKLMGINLGRGPGWRIRVGDLQTFVTERSSYAAENPPPRM
jgi:excisionase family DNA binding protein